MNPRSDFRLPADGPRLPIQMKRFVLSLFACVLLPLAGAGEFSKIYSVKGVIKVEYHRPFLLVVTYSMPELKRARQEVDQILKDRSDPDAAALEPFNLRYYTLSVYRMHLAEQKLVESANTAKKLRAVYKGCRFASIVTFDWDAPDPISEYRRLWRRQLPPSASDLEAMRANVALHIEALAKNGERPEKLICLVMPSAGTLFYPIYDGQIRARGVEIPYHEFEKALPSSAKSKR